MSAPVYTEDESNILHKKTKFSNSEKDEELREAAASGDDLRVQQLLKWAGCGLSVNGQNCVNGWSALHWASKRNHVSIVQQLLASGADPSLKTMKGETAVQLATEDDVIELLGGSRGAHTRSCQTQSLPIVPHYLSCPDFPYNSQSNEQTVVPTSQSVQIPSSQRAPPVSHAVSHHNNGQLREKQSSLPSDMTSNGMPWSDAYITPSHIICSDDLVLKVRIADAIDPDFIEIDVPRGSRGGLVSALTYESLVSTMCVELGVERKRVLKVRKLPNTIVRRDRDMHRLTDFQELELVVDLSPL